MSTRSEKRRGPSTRTLPRGLVSETPGAGIDARSEWRDLSAVVGSLPNWVTEENLVDTVQGIVIALNGPIARYILEVGKFIDEGGRYNGP